MSIYWWLYVVEDINKKESVLKQKASLNSFELVRLDVTEVFEVSVFVTNWDVGNM